MYDLNWLTAQSVVAELDTKNASRFLDLGCGAGHYSIALLERNPKLSATLVDLPLAIGLARDALNRANLSNRAHFLACDLYGGEEIAIEASSFDFAIISQLLHMEGPAENAGLIRRTAELLSPSGRIIIHDMFLEEDKAHPSASSMFAVHMLAMTQRGELYSASEICNWLTEAGLTPRVVSTSPFLIEGLREF